MNERLQRIETAATGCHRWRLHEAQCVLKSFGNPLVDMAVDERAGEAKDRAPARDAAIPRRWVFENNSGSLSWSFNPSLP